MYAEQVTLQHLLEVMTSSTDITTLNIGGKLFQDALGTIDYIKLKRYCQDMEYDSDAIYYDMMDDDTQSNIYAFFLMSKHIRNKMNKYRSIKKTINKYGPALFSNKMMSKNELPKLSKVNHMQLDPMYFFDKQHSIAHLSLSYQLQQSSVADSFTQQSKPYYIYDKKIYAHWQRSHACVFGFIRRTNIYIPYDACDIIFKFYYKDFVMDLLLPIPDLTVGMGETEFIKRVNLCCAVFDFRVGYLDEDYELAKQMKYKQLTQVDQYFVAITTDELKSEKLLTALMHMFSCNLFRSLPMTNNNCSNVYDEPLTLEFKEPAWQHLQVVYDLLLRVAINININKKQMVKYYDANFFKNLIKLCGSEDVDERIYVRTILHRIYGRFMPTRLRIRQTMSNYCYQAIYNPDINNGTGIAGLLEIIKSIIHGFSLPVKKQHKDFLRNVLVPLHKCRKSKIAKFHKQLVSCLGQFIDKDVTVAPIILGGILRFWPIQSAVKEEMFIMEVVSVFDFMINRKNGFSWSDNKVICLYIIDKLTCCMKSYHHNVAERALLALKEDSIRLLIVRDTKTIWPKIVRALLENEKDWNESFRKCTESLRKYNQEAMDVFKNRDPVTFYKIKQEYEKNQQARSPDNNAIRQNKWIKIRQMAMNNWLATLGIKYS